MNQSWDATDSDEDELGGTDTESEAAPRAFDAQSDTDEVRITSMDDDRRDYMQQGCGCSFDCYKQFTDDEALCFLPLLKYGFNTKQTEE